MKTLLSVFELFLAIPLSILTLPLLLLVFTIKAIKGKPAARATVIEMDTIPVATSNAG